MTKIWILLYFSTIPTSSLEFIPSTQYLKTFSSHTLISKEEMKTDWGKEYFIGLSFAKELDLYRAVTSFKRAAILVEDLNKKKEITYRMVLAYYIAQKYEDVIYTFEHSVLTNLQKSSPFFKDLSILLFDSYLKENKNNRSLEILNTINRTFPDLGEKLYFTYHLLSKNIEILQTEIGKEGNKNLETIAESTNRMLAFYHEERKNPALARFLNAIIPGAGYFYLGQKQSGTTALLLNGLFVGSIYHFAKNRNYFFATICTSLEIGWYLGGIIGVGEKTDWYNNRIYEKYRYHNMYNNKLFPTMMIKHVF